MEKGQGSGLAQAPPEPVEALLGRLTLVEEAAEEFVWEDEVTDPPEKAKWLAIAKVLQQGASAPVLSSPTCDRPGIQREMLFGGGSMGTSSRSNSTVSATGIKR